MGSIGNEFNVNLSSLKFVQGYVKRPTLEAKRWIEHLKFKWGDEWRQHISEVTGLDKKVLRELSIIDIHLPIQVEQRDKEYVVRNGTHTCYFYWQEKRPIICARCIDSSTPNGIKIYTFEEIRVEED